MQIQCEYRDRHSNNISSGLSRETQEEQRMIVISLEQFEISIPVGPIAKTSHYNIKANRVRDTSVRTSRLQGGHGARIFDLLNDRLPNQSDVRCYCFFLLSCDS